MTDGLIKDKELARDLSAQEVTDRERMVKCLDMGSSGGNRTTGGGGLGGVGGGLGSQASTGGRGVVGLSGGRGVSLGNIYETYLSHPMREKHEGVPSRLIGSVLALLYDVSHPFIVREEWIRYPRPTYSYRIVYTL